MPCRSSKGDIGCGAPQAFDKTIFSCQRTHCRTYCSYRSFDSFEELNLLFDFVDPAFGTFNFAHLDSAQGLIEFG